MICPDDHHHECDNRGYRYGGCQGRPSEELVAHREPRFGKNVTVENPKGGTLSAPIAHPSAVSGSSAGSEFHD
jgi:hypothetical protein